MKRGGLRRSEGWEHRKIRGKDSAKRWIRRLASSPTLIPQVFSHVSAAFSLSSVRLPRFLCRVDGHVE